ncbi:hypothetical protein [Arthrobacter sp. NIO-1057]|uniref:hypothetical protein n=1 Tax=Arthrobacter sp. NIO-1057 TaxID=993071 RepID=UPI001146BCB5|nr:hypothetical protein [Arthrobacter sp. NIO-1057]
MSEFEPRSLRSLNMYQSIRLSVGFVLCAVVLTGCSVFRDYSGDTCDGRKPVGSLEQAGKDLVTAAYAQDRAGVCRVTAPSPDGDLDDSMVTATREILVERGINPQNVSVEIGEQFGSAIAVHLTDGSQREDRKLNVGGTMVRDDGFTIGLPPEVYPEMPEHPASQSASTEDTR